MKKRYPVYSNNKFYNTNKETVVIELKDVIFHYIANIFNKNYLYKSGKRNSLLPMPLSFDHFFLQSKNILTNDILVMPLGHASVLVIYKNKVILFDPLFNESSFFFKRHASSIDIKYLPQVDVIIFSHNHPDHYNKKDLLLLLERSPHVQIIAPSGFTDFLKGEGVSTEFVTSMTWWEEKSLFVGMIKCTALPAVHWSQSNIIDKNETLWASWMLTIEGVNIYFAGDTAYSDHFKSIQENFGRIEIACMPIAPYQPYRLQIDSHINPEQSFQAFLDLGQPVFIPIHWGVFAYGDEPLKEPIEKIIRMFHDNNVMKKLKSTIINIPYIYKKEK
jgi:L-ascorbate metabolism protein UlaG (beta-lactamase superfamily)